MANGNVVLITISQNTEGKLYYPVTRLNRKDVNIKDEFLVEVFNIWVEINYKESREDFTSSPLWHNSLTKIPNHPIFLRQWSKQHVY